MIDAIAGRAAPKETGPPHHVACAPPLRVRASGFTLVELLTVMLILGVLLVFALPLYLAHTRHAARSVVRENLRTLAVAAQAFRLRTGAYPPDFAPGGNGNQGTGNNGGGNNTNVNQGNQGNGGNSGAGPPAAFVGPDGDLPALPRGPLGVVYGWQRVGGRFVVEARETDQDVLSAAAGEAASYCLETQRWQGVE